MAKKNEKPKVKKAVDGTMGVPGYYQPIPDNIAYHNSCILREIQHLKGVTGEVVPLDGDFSDTGENTIRNEFNIRIQAHFDAIKAIQNS